MDAQAVAIVLAAGLTLFGVLFATWYPIHKRTKESHYLLQGNGTGIPVPDLLVKVLDRQAAQSAEHDVFVRETRGVHTELRTEQRSQREILEGLVDLRDVIRGQKP